MILWSLDTEFYCPSGENCRSRMIFCFFENSTPLLNKLHDLSHSSMNEQNLELISTKFKLRVSVLLCLSSNVQQIDATATI